MAITTRQPVFHAMRSLLGMGSASNAKSAAPSTTTATKASDVAPDWRATSANLMESFIQSGYVIGINKPGIANLEKKIMGEMEAFIRDNPKLSADELDKAAKRVTMRHLSMARTDGQREAKIKARLQELQQDRWG
ncbi:hypothetical protein [Myxococcus xanthus]|uniref:Uncharacterized protein n=1 Tax=Myxococcus xanthus TaxID=34 RepID=A0A7Y4II11_MYXXA|nr:hypothetical protein [Myxococcus xanthus]NOJ79652.1 hypothetical protein [Myxococcus xanthus]NOJ85926.1 hypothetical protein [Myxococcus xanthus]